MKIDHCLRPVLRRKSDRRAWVLELVGVDTILWLAAGKPMILGLAAGMTLRPTVETAFQFVDAIRRPALDRTSGGVVRTFAYFVQGIFWCCACQTASLVGQLMALFAHHSSW